MLTAKQEKFCIEIAEGKSYSEAYRNCYDCSNMQDTTINREAFRLMQNPNITTRIKYLRDLIINGKKITMEEYMARLTNLSIIAEKRGNYSAAIKAEIEKAKLSGLYDKS